MSFSKVTYDTRRAEGIAQEQLEKQRKLSEINKKMAKIEKREKHIKRKHEELISNRQQRRLSEMAPAKQISGYSSFGKAISPKNATKASVGTFGSSEKKTASPLSPTNNKSNNNNSPSTPIVKSQPRRRTVTLQELEKIQNLVGVDSANAIRRQNAQARIAEKLNASRRASSVMKKKISETPPVNKINTTKRYSMSARKAVDYSVKTNTAATKAKNDRRRSAFVRRAPSGLMSNKVKRGSFSMGRNMKLDNNNNKRRMSTYIPSKLKQNGDIVKDNGSNNDTSNQINYNETNSMTAKDINRLRQHAVSKAISYEKLGVTDKKRKSSTKMTEIERMQFRLKESYELIDQLSEQLMPFLQQSERMGILPKSNDSFNSNNVKKITKKSNNSSGGGETTPAYRIIEIRGLRQRVQTLEDAVLAKERQINHWRKIAENAQNSESKFLFLMPFLKSCTVFVVVLYCQYCQYCRNVHIVVLSIRYAPQTR